MTSDQSLWQQYQALLAEYAYPELWAVRWRAFKRLLRKLRGLPYRDLRGDR